MKWIAPIILLLAQPVFGQYAEHFPRILLDYENSVCRISVDDGGGVRSHGSGVLIQAPEQFKLKTQEYVFTCYHIIKDRRGNITVTWDGTNKFLAKVVAVRPGCDAAILRVPSPPDAILRVPIAKREVDKNELAFAFGFGDTTENRLRCTGGSVVELTSNIYGDQVWFDFAGSTRNGDSGGPVFVVRNNQPYVVGNAWGSSFDTSKRHHTVAATRLRVIHRLFGLEKAPGNPHPGGTSTLVGYGNPPLNQRISQPVQPSIMSGGS